ncbi:hypothetical protein HK100_006593 [Physocladia obscura]|uniref:Peptidase C14 caspase domain-containing protein n=1 Tax=Physocladia obscura TaxID=109957 RepID=A0AAD5T5S1_9FUNG|nr:hypothetical protein HK100_006593 [Physocladia obscura]
MSQHNHQQNIHQQYNHPHHSQGPPPAHSLQNPVAHSDLVNTTTGQSQWTAPIAVSVPHPQQQYTQQQYSQQQQATIPQQQQQSQFRPSGRKKALLVGINYTGSQVALEGCVNDANNLRNLLIRQYGFKSDKQSMLILTDDSKDQRFQPTGKNMLAGFHWLVSGSQPGDHLFFSYSGHGSQIKDEDGDREDGMDDTICPVDFLQNGQISSDLLHKALVTPLPVGTKLTVIMDCCHSGTMLELPYTYQPDEHGKMSQVDIVKEGVQIFSQVKELFQGGLSAGKIQQAAGIFAEIRTLAAAFSGNQPESQAGFKHEDFIEAKNEAPKEAYLISGCLDNQTSADAKLDGRASGALTYAFLSIVRENPQLSYEQLLVHLRVFMREDRFKQIPQLSCGFPVDPHAVFTL